MMRQVFLLGCGFTRAVMEDVGKEAPLTKDLMQALPIGCFPEIIEDYRDSFPDVEQFFTLLDLKYLSAKKTNESLATRLEEIRKQLVTKIVGLVDIENLDFQSLDERPLLKKFISKIPEKATILTLNYDCVLDRGLWLSRRWAPDKGYYIPGYNFYLEPGDIFQEFPQIKDNIFLLKLHGSVNFRLFTKEFSKKIGEEEQDQDIHILRGNQIFPGDSYPDNQEEIELEKSPQIVTMSYVKNFSRSIWELWRKAIEQLQQADTLTIIGCSLREEDSLLKFALSYLNRTIPPELAAGRFISRIERINIVDPSGENSESLAHKLGVEELKQKNSEFEIKFYKSLEEYCKE